MHTYINCPICNYPHSKNLYKNGKHTILKCGKCEFAWLKNYPSLKESSDLYQKQSYFEEREMESLFQDQLSKFNFVKRYINKRAKILDYGCGTGEFLKICKEKGFKAVGYDISKYVAKSVYQKYKIPVVSARLSKKIFKKAEFDAIVMFGVIEHIPEFLKVLKYLNHWLKKDGILFITTPNINSWDAKVSGKYWYGFDRRIPEHINYFSPKSIKKVLEESDFYTEKILPWGFVRSLNFFLAKLSLGKFKTIPLIGEKNIFFPIIDMIVVTRKRLRSFAS